MGGGQVLGWGGGGGSQIFVLNSQVSLSRVATREVLGMIKWLHWGYKLLLLAFVAGLVAVEWCRPSVHCVHSKTVEQWQIDWISELLHHRWRILLTGNREWTQAMHAAQKQLLSLQPSSSAGQGEQQLVNKLYLWSHQGGKPNKTQVK